MTLVLRGLRASMEPGAVQTRGATCVDLLDVLKRPKNATVALDLDVERFWGLIESAVRALP
jgi:purine nucleosidase/pyrimidine-specific ribonucleoside hydrolase